MERDDATQPLRLILGTRFVKGGSLRFPVHPIEGRIMTIEQIMPCPGGYCAVFLCPGCDDLHTKPVAALALVSFEDGEKQIAPVVSDGFGFHPAPANPLYLRTLEPRTTLEEVEEGLREIAEELLEELQGNE
jgi:hypothetical protein